MSFFALLDLINKGPPRPWKPGVITKEEFAEEVARIHNEYRRQHHAYALRLNEELCTHAQSWAETLVKQKELSHSNIRYKGTRISENISMKWSSDKRGYTPHEICDQWYEESRTFEFGKEPTTLTAGVGAGARLSIEFGKEPTTVTAGHFTNMVWHNSFEMGVGMSACEKDGRCVVVVCYSPPGNVIGEFTANVLPTSGMSGSTDEHASVSVRWM